MGGQEKLLHLVKNKFAINLLLFSFPSSFSLRQQQRGSGFREEPAAGRAVVRSEKKKTRSRSKTFFSLALLLSLPLSQFSSLSSLSLSPFSHFPPLDESENLGQAPVRRVPRGHQAREGLRRLLGQPQGRRRRLESDFFFSFLERRLLLSSIDESSQTLSPLFSSLHKP